MEEIEEAIDLAASQLGEQKWGVVWQVFRNEIFYLPHCSQLHPFGIFLQPYLSSRRGRTNHSDSRRIPQWVLRVVCGCVVFVFVLNGGYCVIKKVHRSLEEAYLSFVSWAELQGSVFLITLGFTPQKFTHAIILFTFVSVNALSFIDPFTSLGTCQVKNKSRSLSFKGRLILHFASWYFQSSWSVLFTILTYFYFKNRSWA